jgi:hypothetical protein
VSDQYFRPRRRPLLRLVLALSAGVVLLASTVVAAYLRIYVVPPDCQDPQTLALVRQSLTGRFKLPPSISIDNIRMLAGGYLAFRFACTADLSGIDPHSLTPGDTIPGSVYYISRLTDRGTRHQVTVSIQPLLVEKRVQ